MLREFALEDVKPGWKLVSRTRTHPDAVEPELRSRVGGIVVEVFPSFTDRLTGELVPVMYRCLDTDRRHPQDFQTLTADEVDLDQLGGLDRRAANAGAIYLLRLVIPATSKTAGRELRLRGWDDVERIHDAWILAAAWAGVR